jgi:formylglycine-generating enzyme required for sulfatase activity
MHGNVWEWTSDWKLEYEALPSVDPSAPVLPGGADETLSTKVLRGGSYYDEAGFARSGNRWNYAPSIATEYIGFRVVRDVQF